ncbi:MAG: beta-galactosidase [Candidatus Heimdallarchaeota archaeon]|nr:MAG: beta-galactosidase [Candidatus Heimdallarchaeota archaeon]
MSSQDWHPVPGQLITRWVKDLDPLNPLPDYPRPQLCREEWLNLNGFWDYAVRPKKHTEINSYDGKILVPFPLESALSGVKKKLSHKQRLFYRRFFSIPKTWKSNRILLHFGAVDWETRVKLNGKEVGSHKGGFIPFSFDISEFINYEEENELEVIVWDPTNKGRQERGKQSLRPSHAFYTAVSGIWQTVWLEPVPIAYIKSIKVTSDIDNQLVKLKVHVENMQPGQKVTIEVLDDKKRILSTEGKTEFILNIPRPKLWNPKSPFLYDLKLMLSDKTGSLDIVDSYFGMRKIELKSDEEGIPRILLNNQQIFQFGPLDQGYWPDGLYTAPTDEALRYDIEVTKDLGFNMTRKHVKVEPARWYHWCDKMGLLVWQDMPNGGIFSLLTFKLMSRGRRSREVRHQFRRELTEMIDYLYNFPSIVVWVPFNEGWGQFETEEIVDQIRKQDQTRLIDAASGWFDKNVGDIKDIHKYPGPALETDSARVAVLGEFGGLGMKINGHFWTGKRIYWSYSRSKTIEELETKYKELIIKLKPLITQGLTAAIYTQLTDIEGEINGYYTYDREVLKMEKQFLGKLHNELFSDYISTSE